MDLWVLYGPSGSGKSTFIDQYKKNNKSVIISRDIALMFDMQHIDYHKKEFSNKVIEIINDIINNNSPDIISIEIPTSDSEFLDCEKHFYKWIIDVEKNFNNIYIHLFKNTHYDVDKLTKLSPKIYTIGHNPSSIFKHHLSKNTSSHFDELFKTVMTTDEYIGFKRIMGYPDFIQVGKKEVNREVKCYYDDYESCIWEDAKDFIDDDSDKIWLKIFDMLDDGNYELKDMNPIQWKIFEKSAIFETIEHYHDYYESGTRYIIYLSLPDIFKLVN